MHCIGSNSKEWPHGIVALENGKYYRLSSLPLASRAVHINRFKRVSARSFALWFNRKEGGFQPFESPKEYFIIFTFYFIRAFPHARYLQSTTDFLVSIPSKVFSVSTNHSASNDVIDVRFQSAYDHRLICPKIRMELVYRFQIVKVNWWST